MPITALPSPPLRSDPTNFSTRADVFLSALPLFASQASALESNVNGRESSAVAAAASATASASAAAGSASSAQSAASVTAWNPATSYTVGPCVYDTTDFKTYRSKATGVNATRPGLSPTRWELLSFPTVTPVTTSLLAATTLDQVNSILENDSFQSVTGTLTIGKVAKVTTGFTLNTGLVVDGVYSVLNITDSLITITQGAGLTLRVAGFTTSGNRVLLPRGFATIYVESASSYVLIGSGVA